MAGRFIPTVERESIDFMCVVFTQRKIFFFVIYPFLSGIAMWLVGCQAIITNAGSSLTQSGTRSSYTLGGSLLDLHTSSSLKQSTSIGMLCTRMIPRPAKKYNRN